VAVANVLFVEGSCVLLVGDETAKAANPHPPVIAGALKVYGRTAHKQASARRRWRRATLMSAAWREKRQPVGCGLTADEQFRSSSKLIESLGIAQPASSLCATSSSGRVIGVGGCGNAVAVLRREAGGRGGTC